MSNINISDKIHMRIPWNRETGSNCPAVEATFEEKTLLVGRIGMSMLANGTGAWRIRDSMNKAARVLDISCSADVGLETIEYTCFFGTEHLTYALSLRTSGVNTDKLRILSDFMHDFEEKAKTKSVKEINDELEEIKRKKGNYAPWQVGLAAAFACGAFTFLLGGGYPEMICAFIGAGLGNYVRRRMLDRRMALLACIMVSVAIACAAYVGSIKLAEYLWGVSSAHQAGYICAMLFIIPGFPLITGGIDLAKLDIRSGLERISYATLIILVATFTGFAVATILKFSPADFEPLALSDTTTFVFRLIASFIGVYGFSIMFNSTRKMATMAAFCGMIANTLRLELVDFPGMPIGLAAFIGSLVSGLMAVYIHVKADIPRITVTVPSIVIMVPGLYMYRGVYYLSVANISDAGLWLARALIIVFSLPLGLVVARFLTDRRFRHNL